MFHRYRDIWLYIVLDSGYIVNSNKKCFSWFLKVRSHWEASAVNPLFSSGTACLRPSLLLLREAFFWQFLGMRKIKKKKSTIQLNVRTRSAHKCHFWPKQPIKSNRRQVSYSPCHTCFIAGNEKLILKGTDSVLRGPNTCGEKKSTTHGKSQAPTLCQVAGPGAEPEGSSLIRYWTATRMWHETGRWMKSHMNSSSACKEEHFPHKWYKWY